MDRSAGKRSRPSMKTFVKARGQTDILQSGSNHAGSNKRAENSSKAKQVKIGNKHMRTQTCES